MDLSLPSQISPGSFTPLPHTGSFRHVQSRRHAPGHAGPACPSHSSSPATTPSPQPVTSTTAHVAPKNGGSEPSFLSGARTATSMSSVSGVSLTVLYVTFSAVLSNVAP